MIVDMSNPIISFIIPTIDRRESLLHCLRRIHAQSYPHKEVIVVDDNSVDGSREAVLAEFPDTIYFKNPGRVGIGPALEQGARASSGAIWVNLDDDGYLADDDAADRIVGYFESQPDLAAICFRVEAPDGSVRHREIPLRSKRMPDRPTDIGLFLGGAVAFRASALQEVGGYPDVEYYAWEQDVSVRFIKAHKRILFAPDIRFVHLAIPSPQNTGDRESGYVAIRMKLAARYLPAPYAQVHSAIWIGYGLLAAARKAHLGDTWRTVRAGLRDWGTHRADASKRLSLADTRRLSALSGRTWW